ncbi:MAG: lysylphosphatidylglycerol synthase transmembrane domain-containing protein [Gemmataceae bacterium]
MSTQISRRYGLILRMVFSALILGWLATRVNWQHVFAAFAGLRWGYWVAAVGVYIVCQLLCAVRWLWLSRPLGFTQSLGRFTAIYFVGMFFNLFLPTSVGGDAVRAVYLAKGTGRRINALLSVLLDRFSGVVVLIALACIATAMSPVQLPAQFKLLIWGLGVAAILGLLTLPWFAALVAKIHWPGEGRLAWVAAKMRRVGEATGGAVKLFRGRPGMLAGTTLLSIVVQVLNVVVVWLVGIALGLDVSPVYYGVAAPMVTLLTLIPLSLNGVGIREGGMVLFLAPAGVSKEIAITLAFLWFCVQTTTSVLGAAVYLIGHFKPPEPASGEPSSSEGESGEPPAIDHRPGQGRASEYLTVA